MFFPALLLLFVPAEIFFPKHIRLKILAHIDFSEPKVRRRGPWQLPVAWVNGIRSFLGAWLLYNAWEIEPMSGWIRHLSMVYSFIILTLSIVVQMHTKRSKGFFLAPVVYSIGIWLALIPMPVALVAVAAGTVCMVAFRSLAAFFFFGAAMLGGFGVVVLHTGPWGMVVTVLGLLPCLLSVISGRPLSVPIKAELVKDHSRAIVAEVRAQSLGVHSAG